ncbi:MAG: ParB/RepB/Spo0J family partition protein [Oscillospiraceae bacterium]|nr:ParB/RepB/Spo0J family partition protein [Oscillospiraceae bacterium]
MARGGLGGGLGSLFEDNSAKVPTKRTLRISEIEPDRKQPRKYFDSTAIAELADSIRVHGILQPILVRPLPGGGYQIVAGERRWRAARIAGLEEVPVVIRELTELETAQIALIENLQREDLNPIEEAFAFQRLQEEFHMTQEEIASAVGCSRSTITNILRLLRLPQKIQDMIMNQEISRGHAKVLLRFPDEKRMCELAEKCANGEYTVRRLEQLANEAEETREIMAQSAVNLPLSYYGELEMSLREKLGRTVKIHAGKSTGGSLVFPFYNEEDLKSLLYMLFPD